MHRHCWHNNGSYFVFINLVNSKEFQLLVLLINNTHSMLEIYTDMPFVLTNKLINDPVWSIEELRWVFDAISKNIEVLT